MASLPRSTLTFVLPYKRYAATDLLHLAQQYLNESSLSLRGATSHQSSQQRIVLAEHRQGAVDPRKARSPERLKSLSIARRLLYLRSRWDAVFKQTPFFPRFATRVRPP